MRLEKNNFSYENFHSLPFLSVATDESIEKINDKPFVINESCIDIKDLEHKIAQIDLQFEAKIYNPQKNSHSEMIKQDLDQISNLAIHSKYNFGSILIVYENYKNLIAINRSLKDFKGNKYCIKISEPENNIYTIDDIYNIDKNH